MDSKEGRVIYSDAGHGTQNRWGTLGSFQVQVGWFNWSTKHGKRLYMRRWKQPGTVMAVHSGLENNNHWSMSTTLRLGQSVSTILWDIAWCTAEHRVRNSIKYHVNAAVAVSLSERIGPSSLDWIEDELTCDLPSMSSYEIHLTQCLHCVKVL